MMVTVFKRLLVSSAARGPVHRRVPVGDTKERLVCDDCGFVNYQNPKVIVGTVCTDPATQRILLCRRAIQPRYGTWTIPGGFLEEKETLQEGAARETKEEAGADVVVGSLLSVYSISRTSQIHMWFRAELRSEFKAGPESLEVKLFHFDEINLEDISFPSIEQALRYWKDHAHDNSVDVQTITRFPRT